MAESIAEMVFLIALDEMSGEQRVPPDAMQSGVAGGVFADLALHRRITIDDAGLVRRPCAGGRDPGGAAAAHVVDAVGGRERAFPVRHWVEELGPAVFELVYQQLAEAAVLRREHVAGPRRHEIYPAVDLVAAATPRLELARMLCDPRRFTLVFGVVAVLVDIAGLRGTFGADRSGPVVQEIMDELAENLPGDLAAIASGVRTAAAHRAVLPR